MEGRKEEWIDGQSDNYRVPAVHRAPAEGGPNEKKSLYNLCLLLHVYIYIYLLLTFACSSMFFEQLMLSNYM